jgi:hypothetical protein
MEGNDSDNNGVDYNGDHSFNGTGHVNDPQTRDFLAPTNRWPHGGGSGLFPDVTQTFSGSSSFNHSRLGLESLDLNAGEDWSQVHVYVGYIQGDNEVPPMTPPPVCVRSHNVACNLGLDAGIAGEGRRAGTGDTSVRGGFVPPPTCPRGGSSGASGRRRGHSARVRGPGLAIEDDNFNPDYNSQALRVPVQMSVPFFLLYCLLLVHLHA